MSTMLDKKLQAMAKAAKMKAEDAKKAQEVQPEPVKEAPVIVEATKKPRKARSNRSK